jgi:hypothetical protein
MPSSQQRLALDAVDRVNKDHIAKIDRMSPPYKWLAVLGSPAVALAKFKSLGFLGSLAAAFGKVYVDDHKAVDTYKEIVDSWVGDLRGIHGVTVHPDPGNHDNWIIMVAPMEPGDTGITKHVTGVGPHWPDSADARDAGHPDAGGHSASSPDGVMTLPVQTIVGHPDAGGHSHRDPAPQGPQQVDTHAGHSPTDAKPDHNAPAHGHGVVSHPNQDGHAGGGWHSQAGGTHHAYTPDHQPDVRPTPGVSNHAYAPDRHPGPQSGQDAHHYYDPGQQNTNPSHQPDEQSANAAAAASHHQYDPAHSAAAELASQATEAAAHNSQLAADEAQAAAAAHAAAVATAAQQAAEMASQAHIDLG